MRLLARTKCHLALAAALVVAPAFILGCRAPGAAELRGQARHMSGIYRAAPIIRVQLVGEADNDSGIMLRVHGTASVYEYETSRFITKLGGGGLAAAGVRDGQVFIGATAFDASSVELVPHRGGGLGVQNRDYDGTLSIVSTGGGRFSVVNAVDMETYLRGVVASEMPSDWPEEALMSQTIAARTYALWEMALSTSPVYDLAADASAQVYKGRNAYTRRTDNAVRATSGIILLYQEKLFPAYYHACCGGHTENAFDVWGRYDVVPLAGVEDPYCGGSRYSAWRPYRVPVEMVQSKLASAGVDVGALERIVPVDRTESGRARRLRIQGETTREVSASWFRLLVGAANMKSTMLTSVIREGDHFLFYGKGYGHGVGLCQYGAKGMGEEGQGAADILGHFYPDTELIILY